MFKLDGLDAIPAHVRVVFEEDAGALVDAGVDDCERLVAPRYPGEKDDDERQAEEHPENDQDDSNSHVCDGCEHIGHPAFNDLHHDVEHDDGENAPERPALSERCDLMELTPRRFGNRFAKAALDSLPLFAAAAAVMPLESAAGLDPPGPVVALLHILGVVHRLDFYSLSAMEAIVRRSAGILQVPIDDDGTHLIASRSRGTPRVANRLLRRVRDYAQVRGDGEINARTARQALRMLEVDDLGLDVSDRRVLLTLIDKFDGGPVGLDTIAAALSEDADTIMDVYEPYLLQLGFLERTPRGRVATRRAYEHLGREYQPDESAQARLL